MSDREIFLRVIGLTRENLIPFIHCKFYKPIQKTISLQQNWIPIDKGIEIAETMYQAESWQSPRMVVIVRKKIADRPTAIGKTLSIFEGTEFYHRHRYTAYGTNLELSCAEVWRLYRGRADSETESRS